MARFRTKLIRLTACVGSAFLALSTAYGRAPQSLLKIPKLSLSLTTGTLEKHEKNSDLNSSCSSAYKKLYAKQIVNIRVVFGYKDTRPARFVGDRHERLAFVQRILKTCDSTANQACGFERSADNADLFTKTIQGPEKKAVKIQLWVTNSSVGSDDEANRADPFQTWQSNYARSAFFNGFEEANVVFYNGHSRFGGGPDFDPPRLVENAVKSETSAAKNVIKDIDIPYYQGQRPGFTKALDILQTQTFTGAAEKNLKILGLFSCASSQHFKDDIRQYSDVGLISSKNLIYYADAIDNSLSALSAILEMRCRKDFNVALQNGVPAKGMSIQGFLPK